MCVCGGLSYRTEDSFYILVIISCILLGIEYRAFVNAKLIFYLREKEGERERES